MERKGKRQRGTIEEYKRKEILNETRKKGGRNIEGKGKEK